MIARSATRLPVLIRFAPEAGRQDAWGRLEELTASSARLSTASALTRGERVLLSFQLASESFKNLPGEVLHEEGDADGYRIAELRFTDEVVKRRLARALLDVLSR